MSIDLTKQTQPIAQATLHRELNTPAKTGKMAQAQTQSTSAPTRVNVNPQIATLLNDESQDMDTARVAEAQHAIETGNYHIDSDKIARSLVSAIFNS